MEKANKAFNAIIWLVLGLSFIFMIGAFLQAWPILSRMPWDKMLLRF